jgi:hypothetical protein
MKKIVFRYGLVAGLIVSTWMVAGVAWSYRTGDFDGSMIMGYTAMLVAFLFLYAGVKNYRDKKAAGLISFSKALKVGLYITLLTSAIYVAVWLVDYYLFVPDFMDRYCSQILTNFRNSGASAAEISVKTTEITSMKELYKTPMMVALMTFLEIFPVGLLVSLVTALILKRKTRTQGVFA